MNLDQDLLYALHKIISVKDQNVLLNLRIMDLSEFDLALLLEKGLLQITEITQNSYCLIVLTADDLNISLYQMASLYSKLPHQLRKNMKKLYILEPSWSLKMYFNLLTFIASPKFFKKVKWVDDGFIAPYFFTFGVDLETVMTNQLILPRVVKDSISLISDHLQTVGLFRVSPSVKILGKVKTAYNNGDPGNFALDIVNDVHLACSLLKMFVRELPKPIFDDDQCKELKNLKNTPSDSLSRLIQSKILQKLGKAEFILLKEILGLLHKVELNSVSNKMDSKNLVVVWSPNFINTPNDDYDHLKHNSILQGLSFMLKYCVENYKNVFID